MIESDEVTPPMADAATPRRSGPSALAPEETFSGLATAATLVWILLAIGAVGALLVPFARFENMGGEKSLIPILLVDGLTGAGMLLVGLPLWLGTVVRAKNRSEVRQVSTLAAIAVGIFVLALALFFLS